MQLSVKGTKVLVVGVAYKPEVDDLRESPALDIIDLLLKRGAEVAYLDPFVPRLRYDTLALETQPSDADFSQFDAAIIVTHHRGFDYQRLVKTCPLVFDTRNVTRKLTPGEGCKLVRL